MEHPEQRHRELWYNLAREGKVHVSPSSVYRVLRSEDLVSPHIYGKPHRDKIKPDPAAPHQDWMVDITYIPIQAVDWYLIVLLDVYSRYIVGWELSSSMTCRDVQRVIDFAMEDWGLRESQIKPRLHNDNGSQLRAKKLTQWLKEMGVLQDFSRPRVPEDLAMLERFIRTVKQEEVYPGEYVDQYEARDGLGQFIDYYNHRRPHQSLGYVTPFSCSAAKKRTQQRDGGVVKISISESTFSLTRSDTLCLQTKEGFISGTHSRFPADNTIALSAHYIYNLCITNATS